MRRFIAIIAALLPAVAMAMVNVNNAQQSDLQRTKGLDKVKAKAIIEYRAQNGAIDNFEELSKIPGFDSQTIDALKGEVAFSGDPFQPPVKAEAKGKK
ncbi:MAG: helix-hairpin-helix domain-containing protein [Usitatibacter sp.]